MIKNSLMKKLSVIRCARLSDVILTKICLPFRENAISKVDTSDLGPSASASAATGEGMNAPEHNDEENKEGADAPNSSNAQASKDPMSLGKNQE